MSEHAAARLVADAAKRLRTRADEFETMAREGFVRGEEHHIARCKLIALVLSEVADQLEGTG